MVAAAERVRGGRVVSRAGWTMVDQGLVALTNLTLSIVVARSVDIVAFGAFATAFLVYAFVLGLCRALIGQPLQITSASAAPARLRAETAHALGAALVAGSLAGACTAGVGFGIGGQVGVALIAMGAWLPALIMQDACRMAFFTAGAAGRAATIDALWAVVLGAGMTTAFLLHAAGNLLVPIVLWGLGGAIGAGIGMGMLRSGPGFRGTWSWFVDKQRLGRFLGAEFLLNLGIAQVGVLIVGIVVSQAGVGSIRAAQMLLGPTNVLITATMIFGTTEVARRTESTPAQRVRLCATVSAVVGCGIAAYCVVLLALPDSWGLALLGDTWVGAASVLVPLCVLAVAAAVGTGPVATLYGMGLARETFRINVVRAILQVLLLVVGIWRWGALGAAWAIAMSEVAVLPMWFWRLRRALRMPTAAGTETVSSQAR